MRSVIVLLVCLFVCKVAQTQTQENEVKAELVRVRLHQDLPRIEILGQSLSVQGRSASIIQVAIPHRQKITITFDRRQGRNTWIVQGLLPAGQAQIIYDKYVLLSGEQMEMDGRSLPKRILLTKSAKDKIDLVGVMGLDEYLTGVLASEMPLQWPLETLKAQAVASRSYALSIMKSRRHQAYQLESTILDQVYRHVVMGDEKDPLIEKALRAVRETKDVVLRQKNGAVLKAYYHADCGGKTTDPKAVWLYGYNSGTAVDSSCPANPSANWSHSVSKQSVVKKMRQFFSLDSQISLMGLSLIRPAANERVAAVVASLSDGRHLRIEANEFRRMIGYQYLKSTLFEVKDQEQEYDFSGRGFGHGVGMCQWGSRKLGQSGYDYMRILTHYYPLARITNN